MKRDLTNGNIIGNILYFSLPYLLSYFLQTLYGMADLFIIGQFENAAATTAVSVGSQVMHMLTVMIVGLAMGSTVSIGKAVGAKDEKCAALNIGNTVTVFMGLSVVLTLVLITLVNQITAVMSTPAEAVKGTTEYLTICFIGIPFITAYNTLSSVFRGMGDSKSPMYFIMTACFANIGLDYLFIGAMHMGAAGAALGTTCSQAISVVISLIVILKRKIGIKLSKSDFRLQKGIISKIVKTGLPIALQDGFIQISFIVITIIANSRGLIDSAAVGITEKIMSFMFLVPSSMLSTVSTLGAQNIGAGKPEQARKVLRYCAVAAGVFGFIAAVVVQFVADGFVGLFTNETAVVVSGGQYLRGYIWDSFFGGIQFCFSGYFCAIGKSGLSFMHNIISILTVRVPGSYLMSVCFKDNLLPMGCASSAGSVLSIAICVIAYCVVRKNEKRKAY